MGSEIGTVRGEGYNSHTLFWMPSVCPLRVLVVESSVHEGLMVLVIYFFLDSFQGVLVCLLEFREGCLL